MQLDPKLLPEIEATRRRAKALAMLDAILCPEWEYRYYSFNKNWSEGEEMASMRNGSGDEWFILFGAFGAVIKGLDHEASLANDPLFSQEVQRQLPKVFDPFLKEPAVSLDQMSFCYWRQTEDLVWHKVVSPNQALSQSADGSLEYLSMLIEPASSYQQFASEYFELHTPLDAIENIFAFAPLSTALGRSLNPNVSMGELIESASEIGYPIEDGACLS